MEFSQRLNDRLLVEEFFAEYVACLDEDRLEDWPEFFTDDGCYGVWSRENIDADLPAPMFLCRNKRQMKDRVTSCREANIYPDQWNRHLISSIRIMRSEGDDLETSCNYVVLQTRQEGESFIYQTGRSTERFVRKQKGLLLTSRKIVYDTLAVRTLFVLPV